MDLLASRPSGRQIRARSERVSIATCSMRDREPRGNSLSSQGGGNGSMFSAPAYSMSTLQLSGSSKSSTMMSRRPRGNQPLTEKILKIGSELDDPKATDLAYLFEDAKLLHQKLMALNLEDVDLKKVGLFSSETLETIESSARKLKSKAATLGHSSSLASFNGSVPSSASNSPYQSMVSLSNGMSGSVSKKNKSLKRSIISVFGRSKSHKQESERSLNQSRHSFAALTMPRDSPGKSRSRPNSPVRKKSFGRSNSLDFLDRDIDPAEMESSPPPHTSYPRSSSPPTPEAAVGYKMRLARSFSSLTQKNSKKRERAASLKPTAKSSTDVEKWRQLNTDPGVPNTPTATSSPKSNGRFSGNHRAQKSSTDVEKWRQPNMDPGVPNTPTATSSPKSNGRFGGNHHQSSTDIEKWRQPNMDPGVPNTPIATSFPKSNGRFGGNHRTQKFTDVSDYSEPKASRSKQNQVEKQAQDSTPKAPPTLPKPTQQISATGVVTRGFSPNGSSAVSSKRPTVVVRRTISCSDTVSKKISQTSPQCSSPDLSRLSPFDHTQQAAPPQCSSPDSSRLSPFDHTQQATPPLNPTSVSSSLPNTPILGKHGVCACVCVCVCVCMCVCVCARI